MINILSVKGHVTLREAKLAESSYDKVVMWTGGSYDYEDVAPALVRLDRPGMRPGTSGQNCKTVPTHLTDPEADESTNAPVAEDWTQPSTDQPGETRVRKRHRRCEVRLVGCNGIIRFTEVEQDVRHYCRWE